ncbi:MAG: ABC transporter substrate-binding protein [Thermodesulfobacteriota bacterium]
MSLEKKVLGVLLICLLGLGLLIWVAPHFLRSDTIKGKPVESLTVGTSAIDLSALIWIAQARHYFSEQGLDINMKLYESGHLAIRDLFEGGLDLATATEFATARRCLDRRDLRIISILDAAKDQQLVARRDHGITGASDLRNKRIGIAGGTSSDYYLHVFLVLQKIRADDVHVVDLMPSEQVKAIAKGDIDAIMVWEPFATMAKDELGTNAVSWPAQSGEDEYWLLLSTDEIVKKRSPAIERFLSALAWAEEFIRNNETEAIQLMGQQLGSRHKSSLWRNHNFRLGLNRPLIVKMEDELRWMKSSPGSRAPDMPDVLDFIYVDGLSSVSPEKVKILR